MKTDNQYQGIGPLFDTIKCGVESTCVAVDEHGREIPTVDDICANYHKGNKNSVEANKIARKSKETKRLLIIAALEPYDGMIGCYGLTCEEIEKRTGISHQTCSARLSELKNPKQPGGAKIKIVGTRKTKSGSPAAIYQSI